MHIRPDGAFRKVPGAQEAQAEAPPVLEYVPGGQGTPVVSAGGPRYIMVAPSANVPADTSTQPLHPPFATCPGGHLAIAPKPET